MGILPRHLGQRDRAASGWIDTDQRGRRIHLPSGEPHQLINDGTEDMIVYVIADNPIGESCHYPDSGKWLVRSPERRLIRSEALEYFDGEE